VKQLIDEGLKEVMLIMLRVKGTTWIESLVRKLNLEKHVQLCRRLERNKVFSLMASSSLVVTPSLWPEGFGRIPVEANKLGTPAVVSNRGALPEVVTDRVTALVTEPSIHTFAVTISEASRMNWNRQLISRMARARFDPEHIVRDFVLFLQRFV
jgi:glycosyltransferase involved in cell wall biosynthesis